MAVFSKTDLARSMIFRPLSLNNMKETGEVIDHIFGEILAQAEAGATVSIAGFGRFQVKTTAARTGRNPATGETMQIPESRKLTFRPSKSKT